MLILLILKLLYLMLIHSYITFLELMSAQNIFFHLFTFNLPAFLCLMCVSYKQRLVLPFSIIQSGQSLPFTRSGCHLHLMQLLIWSSLRLKTIKENLIQRGVLTQVPPQEAHVDSGGRKKLTS